METEYAAARAAADARVAARSARRWRLWRSWRTRCGLRRPSPLRRPRRPGRTTGSGRSGSARGELDPAELKVRLEALEARASGFWRRRAESVPIPAAAGAAASRRSSRRRSRRSGQPPPPVPPGPPPPPPIPLKFMGTVEKPGMKLAALTDCKGFSYAAREGELIDGRYRLVKIGVESVILEYSNGTGRTTVRKSGDCPR